MDLGIVVLNYSNYMLTEKCVNNLNSFSLKYKIVIVDNDSPNGSFEYLQAKYNENENIEVIKNNINSGYAAGNNFGVRYLLNKYNNIKYICIINPDVIVPNESIFINLVDELKKNEKMAIISGIKIDYQNVNYKWSAWKRPNNLQLLISPLFVSKKLEIDRGKEKLKINNNGIAKVDVIPGCFFIIKSHILKEINYFDEGTFLYQEENIISNKISNLDSNYYSAISIKEYYFHNHVKNKSFKGLKQRLESIKIYNDSLLYLCKNYYNIKLIPFLKMSFFISYIEVIFMYMISFVKNKIIKLGRNIA